MTDNAGRQLRARFREACKDQLVLARELGEAYLQDHPDDGFVWAMYGDVLRGLGCFREAIVALQTARGCDLNDADKAYLHFMFAQVLKAIGDYAAAERELREAVRLEPAKGYLLLFLGVVLRRLERDPEAEECYRRALTLEGDHDEYLLNLGYVLQARGELHEAAHCYEEALKIDPDYEEAKKSLASVRAAIEFREREE